MSAIVPVGNPARLLAGLEPTMAAASTHLGAITDAAEAAVTVLPGPEGIALGQAVAALRANSDDVWTRLYRVLSVIGDPAGLRAAADGWTERVAGPVSDLIAVPTLNTLAADDYWTGPAADAYRNTLPAQGTALTAVHDAAVEIAATLHQLADAITDLWKKGGIAGLGLEATLAVAVATAATLAGTPLAVAAAIGAIAAFVTALATAVDALTSLVTAVRNQATTLTQRLHTDTGFQNGWPRSTSPISSDAALLDGDDTDWHLRR